MILRKLLINQNGDHTIFRECNIEFSAAMPKSNRPEVRIADQIAIRSFVLGHKLPKIGKVFHLIIVPRLNSRVKSTFCNYYASNTISGSGKTADGAQ